MRISAKMANMSGGESRIRTYEPKGNRFTVYRIWPDFAISPKMALTEGFEPSHDYSPNSLAGSPLYHLSKLALAQLEGFEPAQDLRPLSVFKTDPFIHLGKAAHY